MAACAAAWYLVFVRPLGENVTARAEQVVDVPLGRERVVAQSFVGSLDGLGGILVAFRTSRPTQAAVRCELWRLEGEDFRSLSRWTERVSLAPGQTMHRFAFPPVLESAGYTFRFEMSAADAPAAALLATRNDALSSGRLTVNRAAQPGDLLFETMALGRTAYGRFRLHAAYLPPAVTAVGVQLALAGIFVLAALATAIAWMAPSGGSCRAGRMRPVTAVAALLLLCGVLTVAATRDPPRARVIDLMSALAGAQTRTSLALAETARVGQFTVAGVAKRGLYAPPTTHIIWRLKLPREARLRTSLALDERAWNAPGDGVTFRVSISDLKSRTVLLDEYVHPGVWLFDRRWVPVTLDLSPYGGRQIELTLSTLPGPETGGGDTQNDRAIWAEPQIVY